MGGVQENELRIAQAWNGLLEINSEIKINMKRFLMVKFPSFAYLY